MNIRAVYYCVCFLLVVQFIALAAEPDGLELVTDRTANSYILIAPDASYAETLAAEELSRYIEMMTGASLSIFQDKQFPAETKGIAILLGRYDTHPLIKQLIDRGAIQLENIAEITPDGFLIENVKWGTRSCLVLAGVNEHAALYAAYDLLERYGRVGFFRHEEHVPKRDSFVIPECNIRERPFFSTRFHGGQYQYFGIQFYSEDEWQQELRWFAKKRMNRINYIPGPPIGGAASNLVWEKMGISEVQDVSANTEHLQWNQRLNRYALDLGIHAPLPCTTDGTIPTQFVEPFKAKYPNAKYLTIEHGHTQTLIHPNDPLWLKLNQVSMEVYTELFGESRVFGLPTPYPERSPGETFEEQDAIVAAFGDSVGELATWAESNHPGAQWTWDGWAFANKAYWTKRRVKRLFQSLPEDLNMMIWDYPSENEPSYELQDYWHGRPWAYVVFHSSAGNTSVHGDVNSLLGNVFRVLADMRTTKPYGQLHGFGHYTEARDYFPFYRDLVDHMAWNPFLNIGDFTQDYCERRYEPESVTTMVAVHENLIKTVYGPQSDTHMTHGFRTVRLQDPIYWYQLGANWVPFDELHYRVLKAREHWPAELAEALRQAFSVFEGEKDNPAYIRDLADIMRSYVHARMNKAIWDAVSAAQNGDGSAFHRNYRTVDRLFDHQLEAISIVADRWEFSVKELIENFADGPTGRSPEQIRHYLYYVTFGGDKIYDYFRTDRYEMIRDLYRPMTMAALNGLREQVSQGRATKLQADSQSDYGTLMDVTREEVHQASSKESQQIIDRYLQGPLADPPKNPDPAKVVQSFLDAIEQGDI